MITSLGYIERITLKKIHESNTELTSRELNTIRAIIIRFAKKMEEKDESIRFQQEEIENSISIEKIRKKIEKLQNELDSYCDELNEAIKEQNEFKIDAYNNISKFHSAKIEILKELLEED